MGNRGKSKAADSPSRPEDLQNEKKPLLSPQLGDLTPKDPQTENVYSSESDFKMSSAVATPSPTAATSSPRLLTSKKTPESSLPMPKIVEKLTNRQSAPFFPLPAKKDHRPRMSKLSPLTPSGNHRKGMAHRRSNTGKVAAMCVSENIDIALAREHYKALGYSTSIRDDVLHVTNVSGYRPGSTPKPAADRRHHLTSLLNYTLFENAESDERFDMFIFSFGSIVWWGTDLECYRSVVDRVFFYEQKKQTRVSALLSGVNALHRVKEVFEPLLSKFSHHSGNLLNVEHEEELIQQRYDQALIEELFPLWLNFSVGISVEGDAPQGKDPAALADERFLQGLQNDHIFLPSEMPAHKEAISHALAQSVKLDILEPVVDDLLTLARPLPKELSTDGKARITAVAVNKSKGELFLCRMNLRELMDEPEFFWDFPWFDRYYGILRDDYSVEQRVECLEEKLSAVQEIMDMLGDQFTQEHNTRLEWIIIWLIIAAVVIAGVELYTQIRRIRSHRRILLR